MPWVDVFDPRTGFTGFARAYANGENFADPILDRTATQNLVTYCSAVPVLDYIPTGSDPATLRATALKSGYSLMLLSMLAFWCTKAQGYNVATGEDNYLEGGVRFRIRAQTYGVNPSGDPATPALWMGYVGNPMSGGFDVGVLAAGRVSHTDVDNGGEAGDGYGIWHEFTTPPTGVYGVGFGYDSSSPDTDDGTQFAFQIEVFVDEPEPPAEISYNCECDDVSGNRTLKELRDELAERLGFGAQVNHLPPGMTGLLNSFLRGAQRVLYRRYAALRTERIFAWDLVPGVRYYDLDANSDTCTKRIDPLKVSWVGVERDGLWTPLRCGITPERYSHDQTGWPSRYEIRQCIEIWPAPDDEPGKLRIKGHFELEAFQADTDRTTVDDELVFLLALANAKTHYGQADGANYVSQMEALLSNIVAGSHHTRRYVPGARARLEEPEPVWTTGTWPPP